MSTWTVGPQTPNWVSNATIGDGSTPNGGTPPALAYEFAPIDQVGYTRADWLGTGVTRIPETTGGKFRITLNHLKFGRFDPIIMPGTRGLAHLHEFKGNIAVNENSTWQTLRQQPGSNNPGGPLNGSAYWTPALLFLDPNTGLYLPVKSLGTPLYYNIQDLDATKFFRLPRGIEIIGGVDPTDRFNTARLAELPSWVMKETWSGTPGASTLSGRNRYNGFLGWLLTKPGVGNLAPNPASDADINPDSGRPRQLVNSDGSNPWEGVQYAEDPDCILQTTIFQPTAWDRVNLTSPNGRDHLRYPALPSSNYNASAAVAPDGWGRFVEVENKDNYPNSLNGISGHAFRSKVWFSSDLFDMMGNPWPTPHPNGSTPHFDLIPAWDDEILTGPDGWLQQCPGITINGVAGSPGECDSGTINAMFSLEAGARPAGYGNDMSPNPISSGTPPAGSPTKVSCGIPVLNSRIPLAVASC